jgi:YVTN family beta-propeller protein
MAHGTPKIDWLRRFGGFRLITALLVGTVMLGSVAVALAAILVAGPRGDGTAVTPQGWIVTPAGTQVTLGDRPYGIALSPDGKTLLISNDGQSTQSLMVVDRASGAVVQTIPYASPEALFIDVVFSPDGKHAYASAGGNNKIRVYDVQGQQLTERASIPLPTTGPDGKPINPGPAGLAIAPDGRTLYAANSLSDSITIIDTTAAKVTATVPVGHNPYTVLLAPDGRTAYVSNWGEQSVTVLDTATTQVRGTIQVGTHPNALALNPTRNELYVANGDSDSVSVLDIATTTVVRTIDLAPYRGAQEGSSPNALAVAPDGRHLYVTNAGNNDVVVVDLAAPPTPANPNGAAIVGMIPTGWYPTGLALAPEGQTIYVINGKGLGAGPNLNGPNPYRSQTPPDQYVGSMIKGTLSIIPTPSRAQLAQYTQQVIKNNDFDERDKVRLGQTQNTHVIPRHVGDPSPIKHVIYVIKENRTYDQVLGSLGRGNGDPSLNLFDDQSAPNQRQLAREFVTLDNFYADSEVSADGWNWSTAAYANTYVQKSWPANYSGRNRPYEFEGGNLATAPSADPQNAYIWDQLDRAHVAYRNYGFWATGTVPAQVAPTEPELAAHTDLAFPGYNLAITDQTRVDEWLKEFQTYVANGQLPPVEFVRLPNDHTAGTRAGAPTPKAMVADNDLALGRLVDAVSHSPFWATSAIFVVEDDAQNGPDHVDAHRTIAEVISPYSRLGAVDSTFYDTAAMLRTIELIVGVAPLTQFDAAAVPMVNSFSNTPDLAPYTAIAPAQPLNELNGATAPMAAQSAQMDLSVEDRAPEQALNEAIWKSVRGADSEMPAPQTVFRSANKESDDD